MVDKHDTVYLTGNGLTIEDAVKLGALDSKIELPSGVLSKVERGRKPVDDIIAEGKVAYGITTGFGKLSKVVIPPDKLAALQHNIITSHAAGWGEPIPLEQARTMVALRINTFLRGNSGIRPETVQRMIDIFNAGITPEVPSQGSVGASGDLAPLAHISLGYMLGEGKLWNPKTKKYELAADVLTAHGFSTNYELAPKEGLALINGTQFISGLGVHAASRAQKLADASAVALALSLVAFKGHRAAFDPIVAEVRPQAGMAEFATAVRNLTAPGISEVKDDPQDHYSFRTAPIVQGTALNHLSAAVKTLLTEINSSTDNPLVGTTVVDGPNGRIVSAGDFHGQPVATAMDELTLLALKPMADITLQRIQRLTDGVRGLPTLLAPNPEGGNSGFMAHEIAAVASAAEPVIAHSAHSFPSGQTKEDHTSMGPAAARQALRMADRLEHLIALELMAATQAIRIRQKNGETDVVVPEALKPVFEAIDREFAPLDDDRYMNHDRDRVMVLVRDGAIFQETYRGAVLNTEFARNRREHPGQQLLFAEVERKPDARGMVPN